MRTSCLLLIGLLAVTPAAAGVFLKWDACHADGGVAARTFASDTNSGNETLVCSVVLDATLSNLTAFEARIVGQSASGILPTWWQVGNTGSCRPIAASVVLSPDGPGTGCPSAFPPFTVTGGIATFSTNVPSSGGIRFQIAAGVPPGSEGTATAGQEYFLFALRINHVKTVGSDACPGCAEPMCLGVGYLALSTTAASPDPAGVFPMQGASLDEGHLVSWQNSSPGGVYVYQVNPPFGHEIDYAMTCDLATPARNSTWGAVKSLYR